MSKKALLLKANNLKAIQKATALIKKGDVVAFPTETVYGLGANALNAKAAAKIFEVKKRPFFDPLIVHVASPEKALALWSKRSKLAQVLMDKFWPGPLTFVLPKAKNVPDIVTAGLPTVAVRMPSHPVALALIKASGCPIAAPSANPFGYTSPTTAQAVFEDLGNSIPLILDGGPCKHGVESTVIQIENEKMKLLRPGAISVEEINKVLRGKNLWDNSRQTTHLLSPGLLESHYAPHTSFALLDKSFQRSLKDIRNLRGKKIGLLLFKKQKTVKGFVHVEYLSRKNDLREAASNLFVAMRKLDKMKLDLIIAEPVPEKGLGLAIMDRLKKASGGRLGIKHFLFGDK